MHAHTHKYMCAYRRLTEIGQGSAAATFDEGEEKRKRRDATREIDRDAHRRHTPSRTTKNATFALARSSSARKHLRGSPARVVPLRNARETREEERKKEGERERKKRGRENNRECEMRTLAAVIELARGRDAVARLPISRPMSPSQRRPGVNPSHISPSRSPTNWPAAMTMTGCARGTWARSGGRGGETRNSKSEGIRRITTSINTAT